MIQKLSPLSEDNSSCLLEKNHWGYYFTASSSELNKCWFLFFCHLNLTFIHLTSLKCEFYLAAPSPTSGSTPTTVSPGPAKSAAARSPVSVATLVLTALAAPLLSYYCLWRSDSFHGLPWCVWALLRDLVTTLWRDLLVLVCSFSFTVAWTTNPSWHQVVVQYLHGVFRIKLIKPLLGFVPIDCHAVLCSWVLFHIAVCLALTGCKWWQVKMHLQA
jgi:hypothetical protein